MRVLVTGGSGLIGRAFLERLGFSSEDLDLVVLSRRPEALDDLPGGARAVGWDARTPDGWGELVDGSRAVVNLAGAPLADNPLTGRWTERRKAAIRNSRVGVTRAVVEAILAASSPPQVLLQGSAVGFYGPRGDEPVTEESGPGDDFLARVCIDWEEASEPVEAAGVRRVILRTGIVFDPDDGAFPKLVAPFRFLGGSPLGGGDQVLPWIHREDQAGAMVHLLEDPSAAGPYNLSAPEPVTNEELTRALARRTRRLMLPKVPGFVLRAALGEMADMLLTGQRAVPARLEASGYRFRYPRLDAALDELLA